MVGQLIRAAEAPISLSISVARKSVELTGRVAGWALTEIVGVLSSDRQDGSFASADAEPASTSTWESPAADEPVAVMDEAEVVVVTEEEPEVVSPSEEEQEAAKAAAEEETLPSDAVPAEKETVPSDAGPADEPVVSDEDRAVVEHEPGGATSGHARDPHSALNNPIAEADLTEWPDPYDHREDPRDPGEEMVFGGEAGHTQTGATSTSEPHPSQDPEAEAWEGPKRDKVDQ